MGGTKLTYPAIFIPHETGQGYTVEFVDLKGCVTEGDTLTEAIDMAVDAATGWLLGEPAPKPTKNISDIELEEKGSFVRFIDVK
mgnify:CR=1 FL=1